MASEVENPTTQRKINSEAAAWFARLRNQGQSTAENDLFQSWLRADLRHQKAFDRLGELWRRSEHIGDTAAVRKAREHIEVLKHQQHRAAAPHPAFARRQPRKIGFEIKVSLAAAAALLLAVFLAVRFNQPDVLRYETGLGETLAVSLADGSRIRLNTLTALEVDYTQQERRIALSKGQASFTVAPDKSRPFRVAVEGGVVEALGTEFDVYKTADRVTVTLLEGKVLVSTAPPQPQVQPAALQLAAGERVFLKAGRLSSIADADIDVATAWQKGELIFKNIPLRDAVEEANRYSSLKLSISEKSLHELRVSGVFAAGNSEDIAKAVGLFYGLRISRASNNEIILLPPLKKLKN